MSNLNTKLYYSKFGAYTISEEDRREMEAQERRENEFAHHVLINQEVALPLSPTWFRLLFTKYTEFSGPIDYKSLPEWNGITNLAGRPLFMVKELNGKFYYFRGYPNPGLPGS